MCWQISLLGPAQDLPSLDRALADFGAQANATLQPMLEEQEDEHDKQLRELYARALRFAREVF